jgi:cell cycle sensor histidine kinase DivJ
MERQVFGPLNDRYREYAGVIRTSGAHLLGLVNAMLDLSRLEEGARRLEIERFDARDIAREVAASARPSADEKGVRLTLEIPETPLTSDADPRALRQILFNIVSNGVKFTPTEGQARLALRADGRDLVLEMADSGPGIPPQERDVLGGRFVRGESSAGVEGAGLGLAIVKRLAALHGGGLSFDDAPEGGALVRVRLPVLSRSA